VERAASSLRVLEANIERLGASEGTRIVRGDALAFVGALDLEPFDLAVADPPYGNGLALALAEAFLTRPFARELWLEHRSDESLPEVEGLRQRRYGDTTLSTFEVDPPSTPSSPT
jgi:16S rRNA G966 N2-methylase RsmD